MAKRVQILIAAVVVASISTLATSPSAAGRLESHEGVVVGDLREGGAQSGFADRMLVVKGRNRLTSWRYELRFIDGTPITLTIPKRFPGASNVLVGYELGPFAAIDLPAALTLATPQEISRAACPREPCTVSSDDDPDNARLVFWEVGTQAYATLAMGEWTLVFYDRPDRDRTRAIANALSWSVDGDGFITLSSSDSTVDLTSPNIWMRILTVPNGKRAPSAEIIVTPGCREGDAAVFGPANRFRCYGSAQVAVYPLSEEPGKAPRFLGVQVR